MVFEYFLLASTMLFVAFLKSAWLKGFIGEFKVNALIKNRLDKFNYKILKDVLLPTEEGTTQIDHVIVSKFGIFVIETKNFSNWIFSNIGPLCTQIIYKKKYKFQNPVHQNYKHVKALEKILGESEKNIINIVVFTGDCEFKTDVPSGVVKIRRLISHINSFQNQVIDHDNVENYVRKIEKCRLKNTIKNRIQHIQNIDKIIFEKGYDRPTFEDKIKKLAYKFLILILFFGVYFIFFDQLQKELPNITKNITKIANAPVKGIRENNKELVPQQYQREHIKNFTTYLKPKPTVESMHTFKPKIPTHHSDPIYSWKDEKGQRSFSNSGFPKDKPYTDAKIEWY